MKFKIKRVDNKILKLIVQPLFPERFFYTLTENAE